jgi:hypothetical protein
MTYKGGAADLDWGGLIDSLTGEGEKLSNKSAMFLSKPPGRRKPYLPERVEMLLQHRGVSIHRCRLQRRTVDCWDCGNNWDIYQEKPVDLAVGIRLLEVAAESNSGDRIVLISGDGDFKQACRIAVRWGTSLQVIGFWDSTSHVYRSDERFSFKPLDDFLCANPDPNSHQPRKRSRRILRRP